MEAQEQGDVTYCYNLTNFTEVPSCFRTKFALCPKAWENCYWLKRYLIAMHTFPSPSSLCDATSPLGEARRKLKVKDMLTAKWNNPQSSPAAMPAPFQGAYRKLEFQYIIISSLKGKVAASFASRRKGCDISIATHTPPSASLRSAPSPMGQARLIAFSLNFISKFLVPPLGNCRVSD